MIPVEEDVAGYMEYPKVKVERLQLLPKGM